MAIQKPTISAWENWTASCFVIVHLVTTLRGRTEFKTGDHDLILREGRGDIRRSHVHITKAVLEEAMEDDPTLDARRLRWETNTEAWLTMLPSTVNGTDMGVAVCNVIIVQLIRIMSVILTGNV